jgi:hypothetical protein
MREGVNLSKKCVALSSNLAWLEEGQRGFYYEQMRNVLVSLHIEREFLLVDENRDTLD